MEVPALCLGLVLHSALFSSRTSIFIFFLFFLHSSIFLFLLHIFLYLHFHPAIQIGAAILHPATTTLATVMQQSRTTETQKSEAKKEEEEIAFKEEEYLIPVQSCRLSIRHDTFRSLLLFARDWGLNNVHHMVAARHKHQEFWDVVDDERDASIRDATAFNSFQRPHNANLQRLRIKNKIRTEEKNTTKGSNWKKKADKRFEFGKEN